MRACGIRSQQSILYTPPITSIFIPGILCEILLAYFLMNLKQQGKRKGPMEEKKGKVYRYCFGKQQPCFPEKEGDNKIPPLFRNQYVKDVTANYSGKNSVTIPLQSKQGKYVYLGIFSPDKWIPIDIAMKDGSLVTFHNPEPNIIYIPPDADGKRHIPAGYPFIYKNGKAELLKPATNNMKEAILRREMSIKPTISEWLYRAIIDSKIEASNNPSFINTDLFTDTLQANYYELSPLQTGKKHRYVRYISPPSKRMKLAELSLYQDTLCHKRISLY